MLLTRFLPRLACAFLLGLAAAVSQACAEDAPAKSDEAVRTEVKQLVKDLGSDEYSTRESADAKLRKLGRDALPALKEALERTDDPETMARLKKIVEDHEREAKIDAALADLAAKDPDKALAAVELLSVYRSRKDVVERMNELAKKDTQDGKIAKLCAAEFQRSAEELESLKRSIQGQGLDDATMQRWLAANEKRIEQSSLVKLRREVQGVLPNAKKEEDSSGARETVPLPGE
ncbi:MAG: hypothetical protein L6R28_06905 [Planctomycetes bacterium]|nr:hypothetical protein [Planctomycetota bacterium]